MFKRYCFILLSILWTLGVNGAEEEPNTKPLIKLVGLDIPYVRNHLHKIITNAYSQLGYRVSVDYDNTSRSQVLSDSGFYDGDIGRVESFSQKFKNLVKVEESLGKIQIFLACTSNVPHCENSVLDNPNNSLVTMHGKQAFDDVIKNKPINIIRISQIDKLTEMLKKNRVRYTLVIKHVESGKFLLDVSSLKVSSEYLHEENVFHFIHKRHAALQAPLAKAIRHEIKTVGW
ncbi:hypothetical protein [Paraglaciecola sp.]|uniref:hypothetical protein n=1 Tax=Paraglaciecola sp. TaxID=1920173 RepID=UPI003EF62A78